MGVVELGRVGVWTAALDQMPSSQAVELTAEFEELGYGAVWLPEAVGRDPFVMATRLLGGTSSIKIATGVANIYARDPMTTANAQRSIAEAFEGRFLLGLGVSHPFLVEDLRGHEYRRPLGFMREYLARMTDAPFLAHGPQELPEIVLGALGPGMLALAAAAAAGAHNYLAPHEHTAAARQIMGPDAALYPEQVVVVGSDGETARAVARQNMGIYLGIPNYARHLRRLGFEQADFDGGPGGGPSNRLVDAVTAWGACEQIAARVQEHLDAGADHVCVQVLAADVESAAEGWRILAPALLD